MRDGVGGGSQVGRGEIGEGCKRKGKNVDWIGRMREIPWKTEVGPAWMRGWKLWLGVIYIYKYLCSWFVLLISEYRILNSCYWRPLPDLRIISLIMSVL